MKLLLVFTLLLAVAIANGETIISGIVSGTWTLAGSPYHVTGNITVPSGQTLTINSQQRTSDSISRAGEEPLAQQDDSLYERFLPLRLRHHDRLHQSFSSAQADPSQEQMNVLNKKGKWNRNSQLLRKREESDLHIRKQKRSRTSGMNGVVSSANQQRYESTDSALTAWVRHYASDLVPSDDQAVAIVIDPSDSSIVVTGSSTATLTGFDYLTIKYTRDGDTVWTARYNGPANDDDKAIAMTVDNSGNVYVTGESDGDTWIDFATVKYDASGKEQWVVRYDGPRNDDDEATAISVDNAGNVYVTGYSWGLGTCYDYATIKYNSLGVEQWVARYDGPGNWYDEATAIAVDDSGNVYVTGYSEGYDTYHDYATIKYNASGIEQWVARYDGPRNEYDDATALVIDDSANVYVTGRSEGSATGDDYATIKYNTNGVEQWVARYDGPGNETDVAVAIVVDDSGYVYVTGNSDDTSGNSDYATIKYNSMGTEQWVARYTGSGNGLNDAVAITVDEMGNIYVVGSSAVCPSLWEDCTWKYATVKYNSMGSEQWIQQYNSLIDGRDYGKALVVDKSGNVYVTGVSEGLNTSNDYATIKYSLNGVEQWVAPYNGPGYSHNDAAALAVDNLGNVYVTGSSEGDSPGNFDYATVKYDASGNQEWVARYNGPKNRSDIAEAIAVDDSGNVYVTGRSAGLVTYYDYTTIKYNLIGVEQWVARYNGLGNDDDWATSIAVDDSGNVYVTGFSIGSGTSKDYATIKYNASGVEQWVARYNGSGGGDDNAVALAIDDSGNVYVTGYSLGLGTSNDMATIKYNASGIEEWVARYNSPGNGYDGANAISLDDSGNIFVTGYGANDYTTVKYNTVGVEQWVARYNGPGNGTDVAVAIANDDSGNVYVTGYSEGSGSSSDYATVKYNSAGVEQWVTRYNGIGNNVDQATGLVIDDSGNVFITGYCWNSSTSYDYLTIKYNRSGDEKWAAWYNGSVNSGDCPTAMAMDRNSNLYVTGYSQASGSVYTTIKYNQKEESTKPVIFSITPMKGENKGNISVSISGQNFQQGATVKLAKEGQPDIYADTSLTTVANSTLITTTFDLQNREVGPWNVVMHNPNGDSAVFYNGFTIGAVVIFRITPARGGNTGDASVIIEGQYFRPGAIVKLTREGQEDIVADTLFTSLDSSLIATLFDLRGRELGVWNVVIINPLQDSTVVDNGFLIEAGYERLWIDILGRDQIRAGRAGTYLINYGNFGNTDVDGASILVKVPRDVYSEVILDSIKDPVIYDPRALPPDYDSASVVLELHVPLMQIGKIGSGRLKILPITTRQTIDLNLTIVSQELFLAAEFPNAFSLPTQSNGLHNEKQPSLNLWSTVKIEQFDVVTYPDKPSNITSTTHPFIVTNDFIYTEGKDDNGIPRWLKLTPMQYQVYKSRLKPGSMVSREWYSKYGGYVDNNSRVYSKDIEVDDIQGFREALDKAVGTRIESTNPCIRFPEAKIFDKFNLRVDGQVIPKGVGLIPPNTNMKDDREVASALYQTLKFNRSDGAVFPWNESNGFYMAGKYALIWLKLQISKFGKEKNISINMSIDPNEKQGPSGDGNLRFSSMNDISKYVIYFENVDSATAAAQEVEIKDTLDADLDWDSFSFSDLEIGDTLISVPTPTQSLSISYQLNDTVDIDVNGTYNLSTGIIRWYMKGRDRRNGELADFLPPNDSLVAPKGEGWVSFTINSDSNLATGTRITNRASIVFDVNPPMLTNEVFNTIDAIPPISHVFSTVDSIGVSSFKVKWSGSDDSSGSGLKSYTLYSKLDNGTFKQYQSNLIDTTLAFITQPNHTYQLFTTARDNVGNIEPFKSTAEATIAFNHIKNGWNMFSVPLSVNDNRKNILYPTAVSDAFKYVSDSGYQTQDSLSSGVGYWLKFNGNQGSAISGDVYSVDTIEVTDGWNLVGSVSNPIMTSSISCIPSGIITSSFFGYNGSYFISDTIYPGCGYWVKVNQSGKLILSSEMYPIALSRIKIVSTNEMPPPPPNEEAGIKEIPKRYALQQNYPNPFNPITNIKYDLPVDSKVKLTIYNVLGQVVRTLVDGIETSGYRSVEWNANDIASGVYFYRLEAVSVADPNKTFSKVMKLIVIK